MTAYRDDLPELPPKMAHLPLSDKGYPIPYFVGYVDGQPDFRCADPAKLKRCVRDRRCWLCGSTLGRHLVFAIGPMCIVNRVSSEPPSHRECARYAAQACPFLTLPRARRREANKPEDARPMPGVTVTRNPGVVALWTTRDYELFRAPGGFLFRIGEPESVEWLAEGRCATPSEVRESFDSGVEILRDIAAGTGGVKALVALQLEVERSLAYLPESATTV
jgi:hypothetical protein